MEYREVGSEHFHKRAIERNAAVWYLWAQGLAAVIDYYVALLIELSRGWFGEGAPVGVVLLKVAVFIAVIAYIIQMIASVRLRNRFPEIERPYLSP